MLALFIDLLRSSQISIVCGFDNSDICMKSAAIANLIFLLWTGRKWIAVPEN